MNCCFTLKNIQKVLAVAGMFMVCPLHADNAQIDAMFPNTVISRTNYDKAVKDMKNNANSIIGKSFKWVQDTASKIISSNQKPHPVVSITDNPENFDIGNEMDNIYYLCVSYAFTQETKYKDKAEEFLVAWSKVNKAIPRRNIHEETYSPAVEGYSIIRRSISEDSRKLIDKWITDRMNVFLGTPDLRVNNWGTCLLYQYAMYGYAIDRKDWVQIVKREYPVWVKKNLYPNGTTTDLLGRDAFAYHAYDLLFFARLCRLVAIFEGGYEAADKFYKKDVNWGASIKHSVDFWKPYLMDPVKNFHLEFVQSEWEPDKKRGDYNKKYNPNATCYVVDEMYEMDKSLIEVLQKIRGNNYTFAGALSSLRYLPE